MRCESVALLSSLSRVALAAAFAGAVLSGCTRADDRDPFPSVNDAAASSTASASSGGASGLSFLPSPDPALLDGKVVRAGYAAPISGGTLLVTRNGRTAVAADADRDRVFLVDLVTHAVRDVAVSPRDELGRVVEGDAGTVYVVARRGGAVVAIDLATGNVANRVSVCTAPRGAAYDAASGLLHVACRSGLLVSLRTPTLEVTRRLTLPGDLRDVLVRGSELVVTRFRTAEVLLLGETGNVLRSASPDPNPGCSEASLLYRALLAPDGKLLLVHQTASNSVLRTSQGGYGFACGGGITAPFLSRADLDVRPPLPDGGAIDAVRRPTIGFGSTGLDRAAGPFDVAVSPSGRRVAMLTTGNVWTPPPSPSSAFRDSGGSESTVRIAGTEANPLFTMPSLAIPLGDATPVMKTHGEPTAVAFDGAGNAVVQSREPASLELEDGTLIPLSAESHADTGLALFHLNTGIGVACASCHPEGGEDGHIWHFPSGLRRTQTLEAGITSRAPFHWNGELPTFEALLSEVMMRRMALQVSPSLAQAEALAAWLDTIPRPSAPDDLDAAAALRGRAIFEGAGACVSCHSGLSYSDAKPHDVGTGGVFITPTLFGVGTRTPLLHDGCARTLPDRFGLCGGGDHHGTTSHLSSGQLADLIEFLRSL